MYVTVYEQVGEGLCQEVNHECKLQEGLLEGGEGSRLVAAEIPADLLARILPSSVVKKGQGNYYIKKGARGLVWQGGGGGVQL